MGSPTLATVCFVLAAVALGFGTVNWPMGKLFWGDGSTCSLGFLLAWVAVPLLPMRSPLVNDCATILACAYAVVEVGFSCWRKWCRVGHSTGQPDSVHFPVLVYRRRAPPLFRRSSKPLQNGMRSPFCWLFASLPAGWAVLFAQDTTLLAWGFLLVIVTYGALYYRLTRLHWLPKLPMVGPRVQDVWA
ncbi:MAG: hypothetical protein WCH44_14805 [Betaproteobacteria bacterium]